MSNKKLKEIFGAYVAKRKVLVADTSSTARSSIANIMIQNGAKSQSIILASTYDAAMEEILNKKPDIVICDFNLGPKSGLDLLQKQRAEVADFKKSLFILVTGDSSQSAVARAAEEDVDSYILKPFTPEVFINAVIQTAVSKINPSAYVSKLEEGKDCLQKGEFDQAITLFQEAKKLDPAPALACFYEGQANLMKEIVNSAELLYAEGLNFNRIHYRCLVGLFEVLLKQNRHQDAYDIVKKISQYFPANPHRLTQVLRLAIITKSYEDVERYYQLFINIDEKNPELVKYICAALVVCGKYYLQQKVPTRANTLFQKAAVSSSSGKKILKEIIMALCDAGMFKEAEKYLARFTPQDQSSAEYASMQLYIMSGSSPANAVIEKGRAWINKGIQDPMIYRIVLSKAKAEGLVRAIESLANAAADQWPEHKEEFLGYLS